MITQVYFLLVEIFNIGATAHYTAGHMAMYKSESMAEFVDHYFSKPVEYQIIITLHSVGFIFKSIQRSDTSLALINSLSEYIG
jgi:hypothetical protein